LFRERHTLGFDHLSIRQYFALVDDRGRIVMLANEPAFCAIKAGASLCLQVNPVNHLRVRLTWNKPSAVAVAVQSAGCRNNQSSFLPCVHRILPSCSIYVATYIVAFLLLQPRDSDLVFCLFVATILAWLVDLQNRNRKHSRTCCGFACRNQTGNCWNKL